MKNKIDLVLIADYSLDTQYIERSALFNYLLSEKILNESNSIIEKTCSSLSMMSQSKQDQSLIVNKSNDNTVDTVNYSDKLPSDLLPKIAGYLPARDAMNLMFTSKVNFKLFTPILNPKLELTCVAEGNIIRLRYLIKRNPDAFFQKGEITDPNGQTFYNVSAYQLMKFLRDKLMEKDILPFIPARLQAKLRAQYDEMDSGGLDLIKVNFDPSLPLQEGFNCIRKFVAKYTSFEHSHQVKVVFPLLENPDGIFYYQDKDGIEHLYYVNRITETILQIEPKFNSIEEQMVFAEFKKSFADMEHNSGRRSSDIEHQLIANTLGYRLQRKGIHYKLNEIQYQDSCSQFRLINAYRKYFRLYKEAQNNGEWEKAHTSWREDVGNAQREVMWVLRRLCDKEGFFYNDYQYGFVILNSIPNHDNFILFKGRLPDALGSDFAIVRQWGGELRGWRGAYLASRGIHGSGSACRQFQDLVAVCLLIEKAKEEIIEVKQEENTCLIQ